MDCDVGLRSLYDYVPEPILQKGDKSMFKVYKPEPETKEDIYFKLISHGVGINKGIMLVAVKGNGGALSAGNVLKITANGKVQLQSGVNKNIGLDINPSSGKINVI
jgi:hypothetical protein